jgi:hypothetical protein
VSFDNSNSSNSCRWSLNWQGQVSLRACANVNAQNMCMKVYV